MMSRRPPGTWFVIALFFAAASTVSGVVADDLPARTALDRYVAQPDKSYSWKVLSSFASPSSVSRSDGVGIRSVQDWPT